MKSLLRSPKKSIAKCAALACLIAVATGKVIAGVDVVSSSENELRVKANIPLLKITEQKFADGITYQVILAPGSGQVEVGKPDLPVFGNWILAPNGKEISLIVNQGQPVIYQNISLPPVLPDENDNQSASSPQFIRDERIFGTDADFPGVFSFAEPVKYSRGQPLTMLWVYPYQYNPVRKTLTVYPELEITVHFTGDSKTIPSNLQHPINDQLLRSISVNGEEILSVRKESGDWDTKSNEMGCEMLIITHSNFKSAADTLALWKNKRGIRTKVMSVNTQSCLVIKDSINKAENTFNPAPYYLLFIGDAEFIPTWHVNTHHAILSHPDQGRIGTDWFYADQQYQDYFQVSDYVPDYSYGRLSVDTKAQADSLVARIISYEKNPPSNDLYYYTALAASYFQDDNHDSIADRRFARTAENVKDFLDSKGFVVNRAYTTNSPYPKYWSDSTKYLMGEDALKEEIPNYLKKDHDFPWNGNKNMIKSEIIDGRFLVLHRDHGSRDGWDHPEFRNGDVDALSNGNKRPIIWSINCQTGWFDNEKDDCGSTTGNESESFAEHWLRHQTGGSCGVLAATRISGSIINNWFVWGLMDGIWPNFIDTLDTVTFGNSTCFYRMGDDINYAKSFLKHKFIGDLSTTSTNTMDTTNRYESEIQIYHWFGDPTMEIWTEEPSNITSVEPTDALVKGADKISVKVTINEPDPEEFTVAVYSDQLQKLLGFSTTDNEGVAIIALNAKLIKGDQIRLLATKHNYIPKEKLILVGEGESGFITENRTWDNDTIKIVGNITVEKDITLTIEEGVYVQFMGHYHINVYGQLLAVGTETDSITFRPDDTDTGWHGIRFFDTDLTSQSASKLHYCDLSFGKAEWLISTYQGCGGAVCCVNSSGVEVAHCDIYSNQAAVGGGIYCNNSDITIRHSLIHENTADSGGGMSLMNSSPIIYNVSIFSNSADENGGGLLCYEKSDPMIGKSAVEANQAKNGGGIYLEGYVTNYPQPVLDSVWIKSNDALERGGGIYSLNQSSPVLSRSLLVGNSAGKYGGAVYSQYSSVKMMNATVSQNQADSSGGGFYCYYFAGVDLKNCIVYNNSNGEIIRVNYPSYSSVIYSDIRGGFTGTGNIDSDPLFHSLTGDSAYYLSINSPCLDVGDPLSPHDPDGSRADMGAFYFDHEPATFYPPTANFKADTTYGYYPKTIAFTDLSQKGSGQINKWFWDFGDYSYDTLQHPSHLYSSGGTYTVSLVVQDTNSIKDTIIRQNYITLVAAPPVAEFTADTTEWYKPVTVDFTDQSTQGNGTINQWSWDFGDSSQSTDQNPSHTYPNVGLYTVKLTVTDSNDSTDTKIKTDYINVLKGTYIPGGFVSGTWNLEDAPYVIGGEITVANGQSLAIDPGVEVIFLGHHKFVINGHLDALGTESDTIVFTAKNKTMGWHGLRFINSINSQLSYCKITDGKAEGPTTQDSCGGGILVYNSEINLNNCLINNNFARKNGGGICNLLADIHLNNCVIEENKAAKDGGGIHSFNSGMDGFSNMISRNEAENGGGFFLDGTSNSHANFTEITIQENLAFISGGGAYCNSLTWLTLQQSAIAQNKTHLGHGGGVYLAESSSPTFTGVEIESNQAAARGGGIYFNGAVVPVFNNISITYNSAGSGGGIYFKGFSDPNIWLTGIPVTMNSAMHGGGLYFYNSIGPTLMDVQVTGNTAAGENAFGGGIYFNQSSPAVMNTTIRLNSAFSYQVACGGGLYLYNSSNPQISWCQISNNTSNGRSNSGGGGIFCDVNSNPSITRTSIFGNIVSCEESPPLGGGLYCSGASAPTLKHVTITQNDAIAGAGGAVFSNGTNTHPVVKNSILWDNSPQEIASAGSGSFSASWSDIEGGWAGIGNINLNPIFEDPYYWDYHLGWPNYPVSTAKSPCIDAADPSSPADPDGTCADMGVFYFDQTILPETYDFGDCPDPFYPTLLINNGARHLIDPEVYLGSLIDADTEGQPDATAQGDDNDGVNDDDGVLFSSPWIRGENAQMTVTASVGGYFNAWCDWNADGDWYDAGEQLFDDQPIVAGGHSLSITVPATAALDTTYCRFRFNTIGGLEFDGLANDGEVEDYYVIIVDETFADYAIWPFDENQGTIAHDITGNNNHGTITNPSWTQGFYGNALYYNGSSTFVTVPHSSSLNITSPFSIQAWIKASGTSNYYAIVDKYTYNAAGSSGFSLYLSSGKLRLSIYAGSSGNGDVFGSTDLRDNTFHHVFASWDGSYMRLFVDGQPQGTSTWSNAPASTTANLGIGRRLSGWGGYMNFMGVIDEVKINADPYLHFDFGDAPDPQYQTVMASNGARHLINPAIFLGMRVDTEADGLPDGQAIGDDFAGFDDEDGVFFSSMITPGKTSCLQVDASYPGKLSAWIDFNADGDWYDGGEQIFFNQNLDPGNNHLSFVVPHSAIPGHTFARFRYSTLDINSIEGIALNGEVEDYRIEIRGSTPDWYDGFEDYAIHSDIVGQGNWEMWGTVASSPSASVTSENSLYGDQSVKILGSTNLTGDDILQQFAGCETGQWEISAWQYIPGNASGGSTYFILLNQYDCEGIDCNWSTQVRFNPDQNIVTSEFDGNSVPLQKNLWVKIMVLIDLDNDSQSVYYDDQLLVTKSWTNGVSGGGSLNIAAVNLFSGDLENAYVYYDEISLAPLSAQTVDLAAGWSGISSCLEPMNSSIETLMSPVVNELEIMYNFSGLYWPGQNLNTLLDWNIFSGYVVKMNQDASLFIHGRELQQSTLYLNPGWNLIPVWRQMDAMTALGNIPGFVVAKGVANTEILWPDYNINTMGEMKLGKAYFAFTTSAGVLNFFKSSASNQVIPAPPIISTPWNEVKMTPVSHLVAFSPESLKGLQTGDIIAAFNQNGFCSGVGKISTLKNSQVLILNGDDPTTETIEGFTEGEPVSWKCYRQSTGEVFDLEITCEESLSHSGLFETHGLSAIIEIEFSPLYIAYTNGSVTTVSPNPTSGYISITGLTEIADIQILDLLGNVLFSQSVYLPAGIDLSTLPKGICILIMKSEKKVFTKKLIIN
ncbi:MAG: PKD domain-containing protein [Bacteroidales bacterium]|nr:PKD domain-containing protein [Bacteroidales bacterium]